MGESLAKKLASYLTSECTKTEFVIILPGFMQAPASPQKSVGKNRCLKYFRWKEGFIRHMQTTRVMDIKQLQANHS